MNHSEDGKRVVDQDLIRELAKLLKETELTEIEIEQEGLRVRVARPMANGVLPPGPQAPSTGARRSAGADDRRRCGAGLEQASGRRRLAHGGHGLFGARA